MLVGLLSGNLAGSGPAPPWVLGAGACLAAAGIAAVSLARAPRGCRRRHGSRGCADLLLIVAFLALGAARGAAERDGWCASQKRLLPLVGLCWVAGIIERPGGLSGTAAILTVMQARSARCSRVRALSPPVRLVISHGRLEGHAAISETLPVTVEGFVDIGSPQGRRLPGGWDDRAWLRLQDGAGWAQPLLLRPIAGERPGQVREWDRLRTRLEAAGVAGAAWVAERIGGEEGRLAATFLFGKSAVRAGGRRPAAADGGLQRAGVGHLLAVSGLHVGLIAASLAMLFGWVPLPRALRWILLAAALGCYAALVGSGTSVQRAAGAGAFWCLLRAAGRAGQPLSILILVATAALWAQPALWRGAGFQLSYLVTAALLVGVARRGSAAAPARTAARGAARERRQRTQRWISALGAAQLCAWPLTLTHFGLASPFFLLANALLVPLCGVLMPSLLLGLGIELVGVCPAGVGIALPRLLCRLLLSGGGLLAALCDSWIIAIRPPVAWALGSSLVVIVVLGWPAVRRGLRFALALTVVVALTQLSLARRPDVRLYMLDVGQGEAWILVWPDETWAVDLGPPPGQAGRRARCVVPSLRLCGRVGIDRLFLTHGDADHVGGWRELAAAGWRPKSIYHPVGWQPGCDVQCWIDSLRAAGTTIRALRAGETVGAQARVRVLHPPGPAAPQAPSPGRAAADENANSLALLVEFAGLRLLISGDVPAAGAQRWVRSGTCSSLDLLSAAHHGSADGTPRALLLASTPQALVVSAGRGNRYGHPSRELLAELARLGIPLLRTDRDGTILIAHDRRGWWLRGIASQHYLPLRRPASARRAE